MSVGRGGLSLALSTPYPLNHPVFLRAHLQGDCELQPHCPEGLSAPEWHEAAVTRLAQPSAEPRNGHMVPPARHCPWDQYLFIEVLARLGL